MQICSAFRILYASLLGLGLVYSSYFVHEMGLSQGQLFIIIANLIAFGNTTKAGALLDNKKCVFFLAFANGAKFVAELYQIYLSLPNVQLLQIPTSLSVPVLGTTVLVAYYNRFGD
ncbi:MAG: hypothetical protein IJ788_07515 [Oscillospiraceae bacterium]|nr:hypothetical protein [Oscillospiraceae bacterium]